MNGRSIRSGIIVIALILAGGLWTQAQAQEASVEIGFPFVAAGKTLDAGNYSVDIATNGNVVLTPEKGGAAVEIPQIKKLSKSNVQRAELVFDVVGSARFLAQVWVPGKGGCVVGSQGDAREQQTVRGPKTKK